MYSVASQGDLILEDIHEVARGLPRAYFLIRKDPNAPPLADDMGFSPCAALLDTGASASSISEETATRLGLKVEPQARFWDIGVAGDEEFGVSVPMILGLARCDKQDPEDLRHYRSMGPVRFKVKRGSIGLTLGVQGTIGMSGLTGQVVVLDTGNPLDSGHVPADVRPPDDPNAQGCPFAFRLRMQSFRPVKDRGHIPPLPSLSPNPVIDQVVMEYKGKTSTATWLLDTGGRTSLISTLQAKRLGLMDAHGQEQEEPIAQLPIGGVGGVTMIPVYRLDRLVIPDLSGRRIIYLNVCVGVHDIPCLDPQTQRPSAIDGVLGFNCLSASKTLSGVQTLADNSPPFDKVVIDLSRLQVGLRPKETQIQ